MTFLIILCKPPVQGWCFPKIIFPFNIGTVNYIISILLRRPPLEEVLSIPYPVCFQSSIPQINFSYSISRKIYSRYPLSYQLFPQISFIPSHPKTFPIATIPNGASLSFPKFSNRNFVFSPTKIEACEKSQSFA